MQTATDCRDACRRKSRVQSNGGIRAANRRRPRTFYTRLGRRFADVWERSQPMMRAFLGSSQFAQ
ncbi:hypothetical protein HMPREF0972_01094 [Actinomyces sp. oral taxon 848 str. F0332]|nr:hypothetical protein HMPREF0972_01094 [Actinomyces sp. oral taxon 848 str. F0332]